MMNVGDAFENTQHLLSLDDPILTLRTLQSMRVCDATESVTSIEKAGEGNMNLVMRVTTDRRSVIVKQARPWVEKYPSIAAPVERIHAETDFYDRVADFPGLARQMPLVIGSCSERQLLVLEDLGSANDHSALYDRDAGGQSRDA
ncbi:MAG: hypothetical protein AAF989_17295, partial [Planctomycetota bacterium]